MGQEFLIDTNVIIDLFGQKLSKRANEFLSMNKPNISVISQIELIGWHKSTPQQLKPLIEFINICTVFPIMDEVVNTTIKTKQNKKIHLGDAIIASTCLVYKKHLITSNLKDFINIENLIVIHPSDL